MKGPYDKSDRQKPRRRSLYGLRHGSRDSLAKARALRRHATDAERRLWHRLRRQQVEGARFRRQQPIGPYIVDFFCYEQRLVIEVDGGQHTEQTEYDLARTNYLKDNGLRVLRFWDNEVLLDIDAAVERIREELLSTFPRRGKE